MVLLPFYAILRAIPNKLMGVIALFGSIAMLVFLPWLDTSKVRSARYRPLFKQFFWLFVIVCLLLGYLGSQPPEGGYVIAARICTVYYFAHFLIVLPLLGLFEKTRPLPNSITESVLHGGEERARRLAMTLTRTILALTAAASLAGRCLQPREAARCAAAANLVVCRTVRQVRSGPAPARLQGVQGSLRGLPFDQHAEVPQPADPGGPGFTTAQAAAVAAEYKIKDGPNDQGEMFERDGRLADRFPPPFPNDATARVANGGVLPPDFSVRSPRRAPTIAGSRGSCSTCSPSTRSRGRTTSPLSCWAIAISRPTSRCRRRPCSTICTSPPTRSACRRHYRRPAVTYDDGAPQTVEQYAKDVSAFLMWVAEPHLVARKRLGFQVMIFLLVFAGLLYFTKKKVWRDGGSLNMKRGRSKWAPPGTCRIRRGGDPARGPYLRVVDGRRRGTG